MLINTTDTILLIDLSYFIFYRYFALQKWIKLSENTLNNDEFLEKYERLFVDHLKKIIKKCKVTPQNTILVGDCKRKEIWRNEVFTEYKSNRESTINQNIFPHIINNVIPKLDKIQSYFSDNLEADDIICIITKHINNNIIILTNDNDYLQLIKDNVNIINLPALKSIHSRCNNNPKAGLLTKIIAGDPSDNIPGLVSKKVAKQLIDECNEDTIREYMIAHNLLERFEMNTRLIDMNYIPLHLKEQVIQNIIIKNEFA
jgi:5'-3' exonuclease